MFIESVNTPISVSTIKSRIEQLSIKDGLIPTEESEAHMAKIDLLDFDVIIYGSDLVSELKTFLLEKADNRLKQLMAFHNKSQ